MAAYHDELFEQAWRLARHEPKRPLQASLRRAVSAAYYGLFHLLIHEAAGSMVGRSNQRLVMDNRRLFSRAFEHGEMARAARSFAGGALPDALKRCVAEVPIEIQRVAKTFVHLQEKRHVADYDLSERFTRSDVLELLDQTAQAIEGWRRIRQETSARYFLQWLLIGARVSRR